MTRRPPPQWRAHNLLDQRRRRLLTVLAAEAETADALGDELVAGALADVARLLKALLGVGGAKESWPDRRHDPARATHTLRTSTRP